MTCRTFPVCRAATPARLFTRTLLLCCLGPVPAAHAYVADLIDDIRVHDVSAAPVYTWTAAVTGKAPANDALRATFKVNYDLNPLEEGLRRSGRPFRVTETFLLVNAETAPDTVVKATVATTTITAANQTFTYNPPWGTTTLGSELANSGNTTAEYRIERRRALLNENSDIVTLSVGALAGGAASPVRANSAGIGYNGNLGAANIVPLGADIPSVAVAFAGPLQIYSVQSAGGGLLQIDGFNASGRSLLMASSGAQVRVQPDADSDDASIRFAPDVAFSALWSGAAPAIGHASSPGGVFALSNGGDAALPYSAVMAGARPALLPGDGGSVTFDALTGAVAGDNALWLMFNTGAGAGESVGFLITSAVSEPPAAGLLATGLLCLGGMVLRRRGR